MRPRFHVPEIDPTGGEATLGADEASHLTRVLRLGAGAEIDVFDGRGAMFRARVSTVARERVNVQILEPVAPAAEPAVHITLAVSVLKGDKMDDVVRDVTMMGVAILQPVLSTRSEVTAATLARGHRMVRWQRIAVSSAKQCGRAVVPDLPAPVSLDEWLQRPATGGAIALVEPSAAQGRTMSQVARALVASILVGPEGGWTPEEVSAIEEAGVSLVSLGPRTLRADQAPVVALAALFEAWQAW